MAQAPVRWAPPGWADPIWWARQQLTVMTATTAYLTRVTQILIGTANTAPIEAPPVAGEPSGAAVAEAPPEPALADGTPVPAVTDELAALAEANAPVVPSAITLDDPAETQAGEAPLVPRWDELSLGSIRARLSRLSEEDLVTLHRYEAEHAARPDVLSMLANRLAKVRAEGGPTAVGWAGGSKSWRTSLRSSRAEHYHRES